MILYILAFSGLFVSCFILYCVNAEFVDMVKTLNNPNATESEIKEALKSYNKLTDFVARDLGYDTRWEGDHVVVLTQEVLDREFYQELNNTYNMDTKK